MDQDNLQRLKQDLIKEKEEIEKELIAEGPLERSADASDTLDEKAQDVTLFEERRAVDQSLTQRLKELEESIKKIDEGSYGVCNNCSATIAPKRLVAMPAVQFCFDCATKKSTLM